ncbi:unnamed protein product [Bursaphelenchus xylophilus]|uniref:(pine wood nematode) hypothetical protein n=1 Tax=Bursaphelenchus xylophilus TaxID=6326 RepID=A0A1I7SH52_BURXY|nr:unnamed protein product [Bursaphelenchus xylophilus]CAG9120896.1 unnamed protein product [Bursaphelenchus xylophilus]
MKHGRRCVVQTLSIILTSSAVLLLVFAMVSPHWHVGKRWFSALGFFCFVNKEHREVCRYMNEDLSNEGRLRSGLFNIFQGMEMSAILFGIISVVCGIVFTTCVRPTYFFMLSVFNLLAAVTSCVGIGTVFYFAGRWHHHDSSSPGGISFWMAITADVLFVFGAALGLATYKVEVKEKDKEVFQ